MDKRILSFLLISLISLSLFGCGIKRDPIPYDDVVFSINDNSYQLGTTLGELLKDESVVCNMISLDATLAAKTMTTLDLFISSHDSDNQFSVIVANETDSEIVITDATVREITCKDSEMVNTEIVSIMGLKLSNAPEEWESLFGKCTDTSKSGDINVYIWDGLDIDGSDYKLYITMSAKNDKGDIMMMLLTKDDVPLTHVELTDEK